MNPIYFVCFTTATIIASVILFQGFNTNNTVNVVSLFCGFIIIFSGVYLLDSISRGGPGAKGSQNGGVNGDARILMSEATLLNTFDEESLGLTELHHGDGSEDEEDGN